MTAPHLHLLINHFPIIIPVLAEVLLIYAMLRKNVMLQRTALIGFVIAALVTVVTGTTGTAAEGVMEGYRAIASGAIDAHSDASDWALLAAQIAGAAALLGLILGIRMERRRKSQGTPSTDYLHSYSAPPLWSLWAVLILGLLLNATMYRTAQLGGLIRHPEIDPKYNPSAQTSADTSLPLKAIESTKNIGR